MSDRPLAFMSSRHPSDGALAAGVGGGGVALLMPSSPLREPGIGTFPPLNLSTYTAGEDAGRLAMLAKEMGLSRMRSPKPQLRKHAFKAFLRNHPNNINEDISSENANTEDNECLESAILQAYENIAVSSKRRHPPLRFVFSGYSLWLELDQKDIDDSARGDLDRAMIDAADEFSLGGAIPSPHVTALYGIDTISDEGEMRRVFREDVKRVLLEEAEKRAGGEDGDDIGKLWPDLAATGIIVGAEFNGVDGGEMDMAWAEVSFMTSPEHEALVNALHGLFFRRPSVSEEAASSSSSGEEKKEEYVPRSNLWLPHLSLCYDNPEGFGPNLTRSSIEDFMREKCPTLASAVDNNDTDVRFSRTVSGISLWRTAGRMDQWECLDRLMFECPK